MLLIFFASIGYFISSLLYYTEWDDNLLTYNQSLSIEYSHSLLANREARFITDNTQEKEDEYFNQFNLTYHFHTHDNVAYQISYLNESYASIKLFEIDYQDFITNDSLSQHNLLLIGSSYKGIPAFYGIKPIPSVTIGYLNGHTTAKRFDANNNYAFLDQQTTTNAATVLDTTLTLFWKGYFFEQFKKPILFLELGTVRMQNSIYDYLNVGGSLSLTDQLDIQGQIGSKAVFSRHNTLVFNISLSIRHQF